jgi:hypothetical protein
MFSYQVPPTSAFFSKIVRSIPGTFTGRRTPAVIPDRPAPTTATCVQLLPQELGIGEGKPTFRLGLISTGWSSSSKFPAFLRGIVTVDDNDPFWTASGAPVASAVAGIFSFDNPGMPGIESTSSDGAMVFEAVFKQIQIWLSQTFKGSEAWNFLI